MTDFTNLHIERTLDAPIDKVWDLFATADGFARWYGPAGATIPVAEMDVTVGGKRLIGMEMETPGGPRKMFFAGKYTEIDSPTRLVYTEHMADSEGTAMTAEQMGMPAGTPMETTVEVSLTENGGQTDLVLTHVGVPADSPGAKGWEMAIDKLAAL